MPCEENNTHWPHPRPSLQLLQGGSLGVDFPIPGHFGPKDPKFLDQHSWCLQSSSSFPTAGGQNKEPPSLHPHGADVAQAVLSARLMLLCLHREAQAPTFPQLI